MRSLHHARSAAYRQSGGNAGYAKPEATGREAALCSFGYRVLCVRLNGKERKIFVKKTITRVCVWALSVILVISLLPMSAFAATVAAKQVCEKQEHEHDDGCYKATGEKETVLVCEKEAEGHVHTDECYEQHYELNCQEASHQDKVGCAHTDEKCWSTYTLLVCTADEHTHSDACQQVCTVEAHSHGDSCYTQEKKLVCTLPDQAAEKHTEACYRYVKAEDAKLLCTLTEDAQAHEHTEECYVTQDVKELTCELDEHKHDAKCFTNTTEDGKTLEQALKDALEAAGKDGAEDTQVILILNGQTLNVDQHGTLKNISLKDGQSLSIEDGIVAGGTIQGKGDSVRLITVKNGSVNLSGSTVLTGGNGTGGGAIYVGSNGSLNMSGGTITGNTAIVGSGVASNGGAVLVENGGKFEMSGGTITGNTATGNGGGVSVGQNGQFTMTGGSIDGNEAVVGGGVYVGVDNNNAIKGGEFTLSGGSISNNTATNEGGGVFVDKKWGNSVGNFTMNGGVIDHNTAMAGEGGGVYIKGEGTITSGAITNNVTNTYKDLGGGGIYIEADGVLTLKNAIITGNTANGLGGGLAACVHGKTYVYALEGAIIAGNNALGQGHTEGYQNGQGSYNGSFTDGYSYWATAEDVVKNAAQDIFAAGDAFEASLANPGTATNGQGTAGIIVSNNLPQGSGAANWSGYTFSYVTGENGEPAKDSQGNYIFELTEITDTNNGVVYGNRLVFLTADPSEESVQKAIEAMQGGVIISGNLSTNSHGGGIANNGVLTIGEGPTMTGTNSYRPEPELDKTLMDTNGNELEKVEAFEFQMTDEDGNVVGTVTNDENGKAIFNMLPDYVNERLDSFEGDELVLELFVTELADAEKYSNVIFDGTQYKVVIKITRTVEEVTLGQGTVSMETVTVGEPEIWVLKVDENGDAVVDENGNPVYETAADGIAFTNKYAEPGKPIDPPGGGNNEDDPGDDVTPPPTEEIREPEVPLEELPERPEEAEKREEIELEDPDVPLSDVPQTGDISLGWYGAGILSALGLLMLSLFGRKKSQED